MVVVEQEKTPSDIFTISSFLVVFEPLKCVDKSTNPHVENVEYVKKFAKNKKHVVSKKYIYGWHNDNYAK